LRCASGEAEVRLDRDGDAWLALGFTPPPPPDELVMEIDEPAKTEQAGYRSNAKTSDLFRATLRWRSPSTRFLIFVTAIWFASIVVSYAISFTRESSAAMQSGLLIDVAIGIGLGWFVAGSWLNRTVIELRDGWLRCSHGPVPFLLSKTRPVSLSDVARLDVEAVKAPIKERRKPRKLTWRLVATTENGERFAVVNRLATERQANYLRRRLEHELGRGTDDHPAP